MPTANRFQSSPNANSSNSASIAASKFHLVAGTAAIGLPPDHPVPFEPSQTIGFGLIALFIALWFIPQTKEMMKRMLIPANA